MTRPSLVNIEERAAAATAGPWFQGRNGRPHESTCDVYSKREPHEPDSHDIATYVHSEEDAAFITDARTAVDALTAAVRDVLALHAPAPVYAYIDDCGHPDDGDHGIEVMCGEYVCPDTPTGDVLCLGCGLDEDQDPTPYPCETVRALAAHLDLTDPEGDPTMPETPTPLDLGAIRARSDARRDYADERPESLHDPEHYAALADESAADVPALLAEVERLRAEFDRLEEDLSDRTMDLAEVARLRPMVGDCRCDKNPETTNGPEEDCPQHGRPVAEVWGLVERAEAGWDHARAEVDRLRAEVRLAKASARPAPAWDEEAVLVALVDAHLASVRQVMEDGYPSIFVRSNEDAADAALAVVRRHLPVRPERETVARLIDPDAWLTAAEFEAEYGGFPDWSSDSRPSRQEAALTGADAVLALWPGESRTPKETRRD